MTNNVDLEIDQDCTPDNEGNHPGDGLGLALIGLIIFAYMIIVIGGSIWVF